MNTATATHTTSTFLPRGSYGIACTCGWKMTGFVVKSTAELSGARHEREPDVYAP